MLAVVGVTDPGATRSAGESSRTQAALQSAKKRFEGEGDAILGGSFF